MFQVTVWVVFDGQGSLIVFISNPSVIGYDVLIVISDVAKDIDQGVYSMIKEIRYQ